MPAGWSCLQLYVSRNTHEKLDDQYDTLDLSDDQRKVIRSWIDAIHAQEAAYTAVVFRMGMQCCFAPVCDFKSEVEVVAMIDSLRLVGEM